MQRSLKPPDLAGFRGFESHRLRHSKGQREYITLALDFTQFFDQRLRDAFRAISGRCSVASLSAPRPASSAPQFYSRLVLAIMETLIRLANCDLGHGHSIPDHIGVALSSQ